MRYFLYGFLSLILITMLGVSACSDSSDDSNSPIANSNNTNNENNSILNNTHTNNNNNTISNNDNTNNNDSAVTMTDLEAVISDRDSITIVYTGTNSENSVTQNITLPTTGINSTTITWSSDTPTVIQNNGTVTRPAFGEGNATVILTVTITKGDESETKTFTLTVIETPQTDTEAVTADKNAITIGYGTGNSAEWVTQNITLPTTGASGTTVTWESDNDTHITDDGTVTRPIHTDISVVLTVTISKGSASETTTFTLTVKATSFITKWKTDNTGNVVSNNNQIKLPLDADGTYNFIVQWGDNTSDTITSYNQTEATHTYATAGTYTITITGQIEGFGFSDSGEDGSKLIDVTQWGSVKLHNKGSQFYGCDKLPGFTASQNPQISHITNMSNMFHNAETFNQNLNSWDVSHVTNMSGMFRGTYIFNQPFSSWDVSNVTDMSGMFQVSNLNQDLSSWDVSKVTDMSHMFAGALNFNGNISTWNVSNVTNMQGMFEYTHSFNQDLSSWDVSKVTNMQGMFGYAVGFNGNISTWDVSNVTNMLGLLGGAIIFNGDISSWDVSNVTNMQGMFTQAYAFNGNISSWDVSKVTNMNWMFLEATIFNQDLTGWCVTEISIEPINFALNSALYSSGNKPVWGTCPSL